MGDEEKKKKEIWEYLNLSIMNLHKAVDKHADELAVTNERLAELKDIMTKQNWNFGKIAQELAKK